MSAKTIRWTEQLVIERLVARFSAPAYVVLPQVRNGTGWSRNRTRTADALIVSTWPSRGIWIAGVEIKLLIQDWRRELADVAKSAEIQKWCKYWYVATPKGLVNPNDLPETWGLIECNAKGSEIVVKAPELNPCPPDMQFLASILRTVAENYVPKSAVCAEAAALAEKMGSEHFYALKALREDVRKFREAAGIDLTDSPWKNEQLGKAARMVMDLGLLNGAERLKRLHTEAARVAADCAVLLATSEEVIEP